MAASAEGMRLRLRREPLHHSVGCQAGAYRTDLGGGTNVADFIGTGGIDTLVGGAEADSFVGAAGDDSIVGNDGNDTVAFNVNADGADNVDLGSGDDLVNVTAAGAGQVRITFTSAEVGNGVANDAGTLTNQDGALAVRLQAENGTDAPIGAVARYDDEGVRFVSATSGLTFDVRDLVSGASRGDQFTAVSLGSQSADEITTTGVPTYVNAGQGNDRLTGSAANDFLVGGAGLDILSGGGGNDSFLGGAGADTISGEAGDDTTIINISTDGEDLVDGGVGIDRVNIAAATAGQVRLSFTSSEVGNGAAIDGDAGANQDGGLAVRAQLEDSGTPSGSISRFDDEGVLFVATTDGLTFDVRDLVSGAARGEQFRAVGLGTNGADTFAASGEASYFNGGAGNDYLTGAQSADFLVGGVGADSLSGGLGADSFIGGSGNDTIAGGAGTDLITYTGTRANYGFILGEDGSLRVTDLRNGTPDGQDHLSGVETFRFSEGLLDAGRLFDNTLSVATLTYQFFTGRTPTEGGYDYLIDSPLNPNDLSDAYYQPFNLENRFINFAVNLGVLGEGRIGFESDYGNLTLAQAATQAYREIFGFDPVAGKIDQILNTDVLGDLNRTEYFQAVTGSASSDSLAVKAALVGFFLVEAVKADLGPYATANSAFLDDLLADGTAEYNVNLLSTYAELGTL